MRQFAREYKSTLHWAQPVALQDTVYVARGTFNALNRPTKTSNDDGSSTTWTYGRSGQVDTIIASVPSETPGQTNEVQFLKNTDYNARNQLTRIEYGNGAVGTRTYDPITFLTTNIRVIRPGPAGGLDVLQDLSYTYDAVGNVTQIQDNAQDLIYFRVGASTPQTPIPTMRSTDSLQQQGAST